jgi:succinoglycan biosynthesis protein ExoO
MNPDSNVLVVVTYYQCEKWLEQCLISIFSQTRMPDAVVVVDDCSDVTPVEIVSKFPRATLLRTMENGGPFRILQAMIERADYEVIMFQDADDWSSPVRLDVLLHAAQKTKAELIGCQIELYSEWPIKEPTLVLPDNPRVALLEDPLRHTVFLGTAILDRSFALRLGGFSAGFRFGADSEFIRRAAFGGIVRNIRDKLYFRRIRQDSLTHQKDTGFGSPERIRIQKIIQRSGLALIGEVKSGRNPNLAPVCKGQGAELEYVAGPKLRGIL